jgi:hypothetical protein
VSRPALGPTQPPVQWVLGVLSPGVKRGRGMTLTTHPHPVPRSRMSRSYTSSPPSAYMACRETALLYFTLLSYVFYFVSSEICFLIFYIICVLQYFSCINVFVLGSNWRFWLLSAH